jgi:hypothetical protein
MEIKPKIGFDNIRFGMLKEHIIEHFGPPDKIIIDEYDKDEVRLSWNKLNLTMTFQADHRFTYFSSSNPDLTYKGKSIIGATIEEAKDNVFGELISHWEFEDYETFETHFAENLWLTLYSKYGKVIEFELGVPFKDENEYEWPD